MWIGGIANVYTLLPQSFLWIGLIAAFAPSFEFILGRLTNEFIKLGDALNDRLDSMWLTERRPAADGKDKEEMSCRRR